MRYRANDFMARPEKFAGEVTRGVYEYPGFHTASSEDTTYAYAQLKAVSYLLGTDVEPESADEQTIEDYPVVVALDMSGMQRHVDYDAVKAVKPHLVDLAKEVMADRDVARGDKSPTDELDSMVEFGENQQDMPDSALQWLFQYGSAVVENPAFSLRDFALSHDDPDGFVAQLASGEIADEDLAEITGQFRYVDDVPTSRIVSVQYVRPWWPTIFDPEMDEEQSELIEALEAAGWNVLTVEDIYSFSLSPASLTVYERKPAPGARIEYHGTSYLNLLSAAPELKLPPPPAPFA